MDAYLITDKAHPLKSLAKKRRTGTRATLLAGVCALALFASAALPGNFAYGETLPQAIGRAISQTQTPPPTAFAAFEKSLGLEAAGSELQLIAPQQRAALEAVAVFLDVLRNREALGMVERHLVTQRQFLRYGQARAGDIADSAWALDEANARLAQAQERLLRIRGNLRMAESRYLAAIGHMPGALEVPRTPIEYVPADLPQAVEQTLMSQAFRQVLPSLGYAQIYDLGALNQNAQNSLKHAVERDVRIAYGRVLTARELVPVLKNNITAKKRALDTLLRHFQNGSGALLQLMESDADLFAERLRLLNTQHAFAYGNYQLLAVSGRLAGITSERNLQTARANSLPRAPELPNSGYQNHSVSERMRLPTQQPHTQIPGPVTGLVTSLPSAATPSSAAPIMAGTSGVGRFSIQLGSYGSAAKAKAEAAQWRARGYPVTIMQRDNGTGLFVLMIPGFASFADASAQADSLQSRENVMAFVVQNGQ